MKPAANFLPWTGCALLLAAGCALAQPPQIQNAKLEARAMRGSLAQAVPEIVNANPGPLWIAWAVPIVAGEHNSCCWTNSSPGCWIEGRPAADAAIRTPNAPVKLEGAQTLYVLIRAEQRLVQKLRTFTEDCPLDAGGLPVYWLSGVSPADHVRYLESFVKDTEVREDRRMAEGAASAIALTKDPAADQVLESWLAATKPEALRKRAVYWLATTRGRRGFDAAARALREDASDKVREHAAFALTQSKEAGGIDLVVRAAKEDRSARVRGQALFWLAQRASKTISEQSIQQALDNDPETEVKKKAVFALTQMPAGEGVSKLIEVAQKHPNAAVRKQAMFWLGQSKDPRATRFFEQVLSR